MDHTHKYWSLLFCIGNYVRVFYMDREPTDLRILRYASLIVPPNSINPLKDRFGVFACPERVIDVLDQEEILHCINELLSQ